MTTTIPTPHQIAVAANKMSGYPAAIAPLCPYVISPRTAAASAEDKTALAELAKVYDPRGTGTPEERAFKVARLIVVALTPGQIGMPGDDEVAQQAAWVEVARRGGYYLGVGAEHPLQVAYALIQLYRTATGDQSALVA